jgi:hypothetical protein
MFKRIALVACLFATLGAGHATAKEVEPPPVTTQPQTVDFVICLDTSGSMSGLIHAARQKLWSVVSEVALLDPEPRLRVALLTYGSPGHAERGDVILQTDLTDNLDLVSEKLFALGTNGGTELVGRVLHYSLAELSWAKESGLKTIFVAGNESAEQDTNKRVADMTRIARTRGIFVNAVYCGGADDGDAASWRSLAQQGMGQFSNIDHNNGSVNITTPFDKELSELSGAVNGTYVWFGKHRKVAAERQKAQDANAKGVGAPAAAQRAEAKASGLYRLKADLLDRAQDEEFDLAKIPVTELPEEMQKLDLAGRKAYLEKKTAERAKIQARIQELSAKRSAYVQEKMTAEKLDDSRSLDRALREAIEAQARQRGFETRAK